MAKRNTFVKTQTWMMTKKPVPKREVKAVTAVRLRPSVKTALQKAALDDARTVNALLEKIAVDWLKEKGFLK